MPFHIFHFSHSNKHTQTDYFLSTTCTYVASEDIKLTDIAYLKDKRWFFEPHRIELCDCDGVCVCVCVCRKTQWNEKEIDIR